MTKLLELAFEEAAKLPDDEQKSFAEFLLSELHNEAKWQSAFSARPDVLSMLADEARADHQAGRTQPIEDLLS